jgi:hypothetical protein
MIIINGTVQTNLQTKTANAEQETDWKSLRKMKEEEIRRKELGFIEGLKKRHEKRLEEIGALVGLDGEKRELVFRLIKVFEGSGKPGVVREFGKFLDVIATNVKTKGENFLSNGFVNYL